MSNKNWQTGSITIDFDSGDLSETHGMCCTALDKLLDQASIQGFELRDGRPTSELDRHTEAELHRITAVITKIRAARAVLSLPLEDSLDPGTKSREESEEPDEADEWYREVIGA